MGLSTLTHLSVEYRHREWNGSLPVLHRHQLPAFDAVEESARNLNSAFPSGEVKKGVAVVVPPRDQRVRDLDGRSRKK